MRHPTDAGLSLYAGGELGFWERWSVRAHTRTCDRCSRAVEEFRAIRDWTLAGAGELPPGIAWDALALEMKANIRVGLAAGQCVAETGPTRAPVRWRIAAFAMPALLLVVAGLVLQTMHPPIRTKPAVAVAPEPAANEEVVLEAGVSGLGFQAEGRGFTLVPRADNIVYSVRAQGVIRARYVDRDTGQVTISHVYAQ